MSPPGWYRRIVQSLELSSGFELFFLLGPGELARPGLTELSKRLARFGEPRWHALHREGFEGLLVGAPQRGCLHLVHGLERMPPSAASELMARLNLNRDRLRELDAPILFWVPEDMYEEVLRQAPDLVAWRSQVDVVSADELDVDEGALESERTAIRAQIEAALEESWDPRHEPADVGILLGHAEEFRVLQQHAGELRPIRGELGVIGYAFVVGADDGRPYRCVTTFASRMGGDAMLRAQQALLAWRPATLVSLGLAGSLDGEAARVGDVVVAREIVEVDGSARFLGKRWLPGHEVLARVDHLERTKPAAYDEWRREAVRALDGQDPSSTELEHLRRDGSIRDAPIVCSGTIVASHTLPLPLASIVVGQLPGAIAISLDTAGLLDASSARRGPPMLVLRGILDIIDAPPDRALVDAVREYAIGNVVRLLLALLRHQLLPRSSARSAAPWDPPGEANERESELERLAHIRARAMQSARLADASIEQGERAQALRVLREQVLPGFDQLGDLRSSSAVNEQIAELLAEQGDVDEALRTYREQVLLAYEQLGDLRSWAATVGRIAGLLAARGDLEQALAIRREQELPAYERLGDIRGCAVTTGRIADLLSQRGELEAALKLRRERELVLYEQLGDAHAQASTMGKIADLLTQRGDLEEALRIRREQELPVYERLGDLRGRALTMAKIEALVSRAHDEP